jgi:hypothetical protein
MLRSLLLCALFACSSAEPTPAGDSDPPDTEVEATCTCDPVCGQRICPSCGGCDDANASVGPWCEETCNGIDDNCDGAIDEGVEATYHPDEDGDQHGDPATSVTACEPPPGWVTSADDCDDGAQTVWAGAPEVCGDGVDQDCDGADSPCG